MKKLLLPGIFFLLLITSCKKDPNSLKSINSEIIGNWYYQSYDIKYYNATIPVIYDAVATAPNLHIDPYYIFGTFNTVNYNGNNFTYAVTSQGGSDSLIFSGSDSSRFKIVSISKTQLVLQRNYPASVLFTNGIETVSSTNAFFYGTFSRVQAP
jgi:hypothetical protein